MKLVPVASVVTPGTVATYAEPSPVVVTAYCPFSAGATVDNAVLI